jgi:inner membrane protein
MVIVEHNDRYHYALVNLVRREPRDSLPGDAGFFERLDAPYLPLRAARWVIAERYGSSAADRSLARDAYGQPAFEFFRWFAAYPALFRIERGNPDACVWFEDLRFFTPGRAHTPFRYGMCREGEDGWKAFRLFDTGHRVPVT